MIAAGRDIGMNLRDPRVTKTIFIAGLVLTAIGVGMALQKLDSGSWTTETAVSLAFSAVAFSAFLRGILRDIWNPHA